MEFGFAVLRVVVGLLIAGHGLQKLSTRLGGIGTDQHAAFLDSLGYRPARAMAVLHGAVELGAGLLLALGLATPLAGALIVAVMINAAVAVHAPNGLWAQNGGMEYPIVLGVVAAAFTLGGPDAYALDPVVGVQPQPTWALGALGLGIILGLVAMASRHLRLSDRRVSA